MATSAARLTTPPQFDGFPLGYAAATAAGLVRSYKDRTSFDRFIGDVYFVSEALHPEAADVLRVGGQRWLCIIEVLIREGLGEAVD